MQLFTLDSDDAHEQRLVKEGAWVSGKVNGLSVHFMLDTGAAVTVVNKEVFNQALADANLQESNVQLVSAGGDTLNVIGKTEMLLELGNRQVTFPVMVSYSDVTHHSDQNLNFTNEISTPEIPHVNVFPDFLMAVLEMLKRQWPPEVVGTVAWNCQEIDISRFIVVFHTNSPLSHPATMLKRRRNMSQDIWCTWST